MYKWFITHFNVVVSTFEVLFIKAQYSSAVRANVVVVMSRHEYLLILMDSFLPF